MSIENRIEKLEEKVGAPQGETRFIIYTLAKRDEQSNWVKRIPTKEALEKAKKEAITRNLSQSGHILYDFDDYYYERITPE